MVDSLHRPIDSNPFIDLFILWLDSPIHLLTRFGPLLIDPREMQYPADSDGAWMVLGWCLDSITCMASDGAWMVLGVIQCYPMLLYVTIIVSYQRLESARAWWVLIGAAWRYWKTPLAQASKHSPLNPSIQSRHPIQAFNPGIVKNSKAKQVVDGLKDIDGQERNSRYSGGWWRLMEVDGDWCYSMHFIISCVYHVYVSCVYHVYVSCVYHVYVSCVYHVYIPRACIVWNLKISLTGPVSSDGGG